MGPHISCLLKGIARWDSKLIKGDRQKGSRVSLFGGRQMGPRFFMLVIKGIARWDSKLIKGDRQKGSRVSLFGGRQMGPRFFSIKGIARWDSKLMEIARRDLVSRYLGVARWDLMFSC